MANLSRRIKALTSCPCASNTHVWGPSRLKNGWSVLHIIFQPNPWVECIILPLCSLYICICFLSFLSPFTTTEGGPPPEVGNLSNPHTLYMYLSLYILYYFYFIYNYYIPLLIFYLVPLYDYILPVNPLPPPPPKEGWGLYYLYLINFIFIFYLLYLLLLPSYLNPKVPKVRVRSLYRYYLYLYNLF